MNPLRHPAINDAIRHAERMTARDGQRRRVYWHQAPDPRTGGTTPGIVFVRLEDDWPDYPAVCVYITGADTEKTGG